MFLKNVLVLDLETTGFEYRHAGNPDRIIDIAMIRISAEGKVDAFQRYINPEGKKSHPMALKKHSLTDDFLKNYDNFNNNAKAIKDFIRSSNLPCCELTGHNVRDFDWAFLNTEFNNCGYSDFTPERIFDTLHLRKVPGQKWPKLNELCDRYNIDTSERIDDSGNETHGALIDATLSAKLYAKMNRIADGDYRKFVDNLDQAVAIAVGSPDRGRSINAFSREEKADKKAS